MGGGKEYFALGTWDCEGRVGEHRRGSENKWTGKPGIPRHPRWGRGVGVVIWGLSAAQGTG